MHNKKSLTFGLLLVIMLAGSGSSVFAQVSVPLQGAQVIISGDNGSGYAVTDVNGHYTINSGIPSGSYTVTVMQPGYLINQTMNINVTSGQVLALNIFLHKSGAISGKVTDSSGNAVTNTYVAITLSNGSDVYGYYGTTDSSGNYDVFTNLGTGSYNVSAGYFVHGYIPARVTVSVTAGQQTSNVNLVLQTSGKITGKITYPNGSAAANAYVYASSGSGYFGYGKTAADGSYTIDTGLGTGSYTLFAGISNFYGNLDNVAVTAGQTTSGVNLQLQQSPYPLPTPGASGTITGKVTDKVTGSPIAGADVVASGNAGFGSNTTDSSGNYIIQSNLGSGTYTVNASASGYAPASITGVSVTVSQTTSNVNFQLQPVPPAQSGTVSGTVTGEPSPVPEFPGGVTLPMMIAVTLLVSAIAIAGKRRRSNKVELGNPSIQ
ncbi:MAG: carboxypeptidase-like regulatory domain-containing protein [Conexivisphaerales archaeon]